MIVVPIPATPASPANPNRSVSRLESLITNLRPAKMTMSKKRVGWTPRRVD
jgi:hypothetical protein